MYKCINLFIFNKDYNKEKKKFSFTKVKVDNNFF